MSFAQQLNLPPDGETADLPACDAEPIHIPSAIQPPGILLVVGKLSFDILQASENAATLLKAGGNILGKPLSDVLPPWYTDRIHERVVSDLIGEMPVPIPPDPDPARSPIEVTVCRQQDLLVVEIDPPLGPHEDLYRLVASGFPSLALATDMEELSAAASIVVRNATGFDRVMVYRFDAEWNGQVTGESLADGLAPWLGLRYPASDIPSQARAMYVRSRSRLIADVNCQPVRILPLINPDTGKPIDLTHAVNRSVSPVHLQYLRNMGVGASMSISIVWQDKLWGMILCHHRTPRRVSFQTRVACDVLAQNLALHLSVREYSRRIAKAIELKSIQPRLLRAMSDAPNLTDGLAEQAGDLLRLGGGNGVAVITDRLFVSGETPAREQLAGLVDWLTDHAAGDVFSTEALPTVYPPALEFKDTASGVLAVSISRTRRWYVLWFRPEVFRTRYWAGDPQKPVEFTANGQVMRPRIDFERWKQTLSLHSAEWEQEHVDAAAEFRGGAVGIVLRQAEERARLSSELERSNKELEAFSYSVSHDLRAPFRHIVGFSELLQKRNKAMDETSQRYMATIVSSARFAGTLVDSLLTFSQMGRAAMRVTRVDLNPIIAEVRHELSVEVGDRQVEWSVQPLPPVMADPVMARLIFRNLLSNAVKYTRDRSPARITVSCLGIEPRDDLAPPPVEPGMEAVANGPLVRIAVADDGAGFDMKYVEKLFGVFQRLHRAEDYEGTGIGLANVRRIVERHGGRISVTAALDKGATFEFTLPAAEPPEVS
jgi:chemotaxis family two-component system sensor kinase Cph1